MNNPSESGKALVAWLRTNVKMLLLGANVLVLLFLTYTLAAQAIFEFRVRGLLAQAGEAATSAQATEKRPEGENRSKRSAPSAQSAQSDQSDRSDRKGSEGQGKKKAKPQARPDSAAPSTTASAPVAASAAATSGPTALDNQAGSATAGTTVSISAVSADTTPAAPLLIVAEPTSPPLVTTAPLPIGLPGPATTGVVAATTLIGTTATALIRPDSLTSGSSVSTGTAGSVQRVMGQVSGVWKQVGRFVGPISKMGPPRSGSMPPGMGRGPRDSREDPKKKEMFAKLEARSLFGGARPQVQKPELDFILGNAAFISGKLVKVGEKVGEDEVVEIRIDRVVLKTPEGQRNELTVSGAGGGGEGGPRSSVAAGGPSPGAGASPGQPGMPSPTMSFGGLGGLTPDMIPEGIFRKLSGPGGPFEGMSREQMIDRVRDMRDRGGGGRRGEGRRGRD